MSFDATVLEVFIASPGGLDAERDVVEKVIADWNAVYAAKEGLILLARRWERDSSSELSGRAQHIINERILDEADIVIGFFHLRIGSPTGDHESGTVEEIKRHHAAGKPVMLYFSEQPAKPGYDADQFAKVAAFKTWAYEQGVVGSFDSPQAFRETLSRELPLLLNKNPYIADLTDVDFVKAFEDGLLVAPKPLSPDASDLLLSASEDNNGQIVVRYNVSGTQVLSAHRQFIEPQTAREVARWKAAVDELLSRGFTNDSEGKRQVYTLSHTGWAEADRIKAERHLG